MNRRNIVIAAAVTMALHVSAAVATDEPEAPSPGKSAEEIINEARERLEGRRREQEKKQRREEQPRSFYFALGGEELTHASLREVDRILAVQREDAPIQYLEPRQNYIPTNADGEWSLAVGYELTRWLDIELAAHALESFWQGGNRGAVYDSTLSAAVQSTDAEQFYRFDASTYSLSLLPRWDISDYVGIFARIGVGYAETMLLTDLSSEGFVSSTRSCTIENGQEKCTTDYNYERQHWGHIHQTRSGVFPIVGIGVQLLPFFRLEYLMRANVPIGEGTTDVRALYFSFRAKTAWL